MYDVLVVGGSYAGISAAIQLGRARRSALVVDAGERRNRFVAHAHGFLGQDGQAPEAIAAKGREELRRYGTIEWRVGEVTEVRAAGSGFVTRIGGEEHASKRVILATGVVDELPAIPGLSGRWGSSVFPCPYCHGFELDRGRIGVLAVSPMSVHHAALVAEWSAPGGTTLFLNGAFEPDEAALADLASREIAIERELVAAIEGDAPQVALRLRDGRLPAFDGLFIATRTKMKTAFAEQLGCELDEGPIGPFYETDVMKETTVPGLCVWRQRERHARHRLCRRRRHARGNLGASVAGLPPPSVNPPSA
ncbi:NAD(P)/FAD-dependent oxidoreductase [soil metagenome]